MTDITSEKRAYTTREAADYLGRSVSFVRALKRNNKIPAKRDGKLLVFFRSDLDLYLDNLEEA